MKTLHPIHSKDKKAMGTELEVEAAGMFQLRVSVDVFPKGLNISIAD